eukprot:5012559-Prymnesium_polylepis.3
MVVHQHHRGVLDTEAVWILLRCDCIEWTSRHLFRRATCPHAHGARYNVYSEATEALGAPVSAISSHTCTM